MNNPEYRKQYMSNLNLQIKNNNTNLNSNSKNSNLIHKRKPLNALQHNGINYPRQKSLNNKPIKQFNGSNYNNIITRRWGKRM